jgi:hypothetical protein
MSIPSEDQIKEQIATDKAKRIMQGSPELFP